MAGTSPSVPLLSCGSPGHPRADLVPPTSAPGENFPRQRVSRLLRCSQGSGDGQGTMKTLAPMKKRTSMKQMAAHMKKVALVVALIAIVFPALSPVSAQVGTSNGQQQVATPNGQLLLGNRGSQPAPSQAPTTGTFCIEEMTATFCNVPVGPNTNGYGSAAGTASTGGSASTAGSTGGGGSRGKRWRGHQRVFPSAVHARTGGERTLLLTGQTAQACGSDCGGFHFCHQFRQRSFKPLWVNPRRDPSDGRACGGPTPALDTLFRQRDHPARLSMRRHHGRPRMAAGPWSRTV
jgi:hypothetical protein